MKKNFDNTDIFDTFKPYEEKEKEAQEEVKTLETIETTIKEETPLKTDKNTLKNSKKVARKNNQNQSEKKSQIYSEVDSIVCDYLNLKTIVTGDSKKDILNSIFKEEIKKSFNLPENATDEEMRKEIDKKLKQIEQMKTLFK